MQDELLSFRYDFESFLRQYHGGTGNSASTLGPLTMNSIQDSTRKSCKATVLSKQRGSVLRLATGTAQVEGLFYRYWLSLVNRVTVHLSKLQLRVVPCRLPGSTPQPLFGSNFYLCRDAVGG
jgi:hypothetical protein